MDSAYGTTKQELDNKSSGAINILSLGSGIAPDEIKSYVTFEDSQLGD